MIRSAIDPDWFVISADLADRLGLSPGKHFRRGRWEVHRSQLPLLGTEAEAARQATPLTTHSERDRLTEPLGFKLRPHQQLGVDFIEPRRGVLLADEPRVGKSLCGVMAHDPSRGPLLVICPLIVREVWLNWLRKRFPGEDIGVLSGKTFDPAAYNRPIVVGHYDVLPSWQSARRLGTLVLDEAHVLSNLKSRRTVAAAFVASRAQKVVALTGTPLWNKTPGLFPILSLLGPSSWGSYYEFRNRYCNPQPTARGTVYLGTSHEAEFKARLSEVMLHRRWAEVAKDLPPTNRRALIAGLTAEKRMEIDIVAESLRTAKTLTATMGAIARYRRALGDIKIPVAIELANELLERGEPVVVWAWHKATAKALRRDLARRFDAFLITGDTDPIKREEVFAAWRKTAGALVITIPAGQVGIDLSHARHTIFAELDFTPALIAQAEMRTFSPLRSMDVVYIIADHDVDKRVLTAMQSKIEISDKVGVPAAEAAIDVLKAAFAIDLPEGDLDRLMRDLLASCIE